MRSPRSFRVTNWCPRTRHALRVRSPSTHPLRRFGHGWRRSVSTAAGSTAIQCWNALSARISTTQSPSTPSGRTCASETPCGSPAATATLGRQVVAAVAPGSHLVLMSPADFERVQRGNKALGAWGFYLRRHAGWTRLIARGSGGAVGHATFDVPHFLMEQQMMRGIRARAEQTRQDQVDAFMRHKYPRETKLQARQITAEKVCVSVLVSGTMTV